MSELRIADERDAALIECIAHHPAVNLTEPVHPDFSAAEALYRAIILVYDEGMFMFEPMQDGRWNAHVATLPEGRGAIAIEQGVTALACMFAMPGIKLIEGRIEQSNKAARFYARAVGMKLQRVEGDKLVYEARREDWRAWADS